MKNIVIVGAGPAGLFSAFELVSSDKKKEYNIYVIDKGKDLEHRVCPMRLGNVCAHCKPCNITSGFGGAGTFSDCKLSLSPYGVGGNITDYIPGVEAEKYVKYVDSIFSMLDKDRSSRKIIGEKNKKYQKIEKKLNSVGLELTYCPTKHLGTDGTLSVMQNLKTLLQDKGVNFIYLTEVKDIQIEGNIKNVVLQDDKSIAADFVILAPGRSGNAWLSNLAKKLNLKVNSNGFDIGYRVELPAKITKELTDNLYDMKISYTYDSGIKVRTFCTNPNGFVSEEHYDDGTALANGHSYANIKSNNTNFAVLVHFPLATEIGKNIVDTFNEYSNHRVIYSNFIETYGLARESKKETKTTLNAEHKRVNYTTPKEFDFYVFDFMKKLNSIYPGITESTTNLYGIEAKFYSDLIRVNKDFETAIQGIYAIGDGSGIARGIIQSACMGIIAAEDIIRNV